jgi:membrane protease YdiL (CAAX protease family)
LIPPQPTSAPEKKWNDISPPDVKWAPLDVFLASAAAIAIVVAVLSFASYVSGIAGFGSDFSSVTALLIGGSAVAIAYLATRFAHARLWPLSVVLVASAIVISLAYLIASDDGGGITLAFGIPVVIIVATAMSSSFAAVAIAYSVALYNEPLSTLGFVKTRGIRPYLFAVAMWILAVSILMFWVQALIWFGVDLLVPPDTAKQALDEAGGSIFVTIILVGILGPIAEEIFFRGFVLPGLIKRFSNSVGCHMARSFLILVDVQYQIENLVCQLASVLGNEHCHGVMESVCEHRWPN